MGDAVKVLLCGDVKGNLRSLYKRFDTVRTLRRSYCAPSRHTTHGDVIPCPIIPQSCCLRAAGHTPLLLSVLPLTLPRFAHR
jgi:hypothetical protein